MTKVNILAIIGMIILGISSCSDTDSFWEGYYAGSTDSLTVCANAQASMLAAQASFEAATDADYVQTCIAYQASIQNYINLCNDTSSVYQNILTELGDCSLEVTLSCEDAETLSSAAAAALDALTPDDENYSSTCLLYVQALLNQIDACGDDDGSIQATINGLECGNDSDCEEAEANTNEAETAYNNTDPSSPNYTEVCEAYADMLELQIVACGDDDGSLQETLDGLDCSGSATEWTGSITLTFGTLPMTFNQNIAVTEANNLYLIYAELDTNSDYYVEFNIPINDTGSDIMTNFMLQTTSLFQPDPNAQAPLDPFTSSITANDGTTIEGTFFGTLINDDNGNTNVYDGVINLSN